MKKSWWKQNGAGLSGNVVTGKLISSLGPEFAAMKTAICLFESWQPLTICRVTTLVEMRERPPVAKRRYELFSPKHKHHKVTDE